MIVNHNKRWNKQTNVKKLNFQSAHLVIELHFVLHVHIHQNWVVL